MKEAIATAASNIMSTSSLHRRKQQKQSLSSKTTVEMANASMPEVKVKRTNWVTMLRVQVKTILCLLLLVLALLSYYLLWDNQIVDIENENGISTIKNENAAPPNGIRKVKIENTAAPNGTRKVKLKNVKNVNDLPRRIRKFKVKSYASPSDITLYESFSNESKIISTIRDIHKQKIDLKGTVEKKPKLYLHVGSPKHGTTSFECALAKIQVSCALSLP
jgi:hypothetical protein